MNTYIHKAISVCAGVLCGILPLSSAYAQEIPAGYVLVPMSALGAAAPMPAMQASVDASVSSVRLKKDYAFVGEAVHVTVTLRGSTGQAIAGKTVTLLSSKNTDSVVAVRGTTDANGEAVFSVSGKAEGVSTLTALDAASGTALFERPKVIFLKKKPIGGNLLSASVLADTAATPTAATAYQNKVSVNFPQKVVAGKPYDITITVLETATGGKNMDFAGDVSFVSSDTSAILPAKKTYGEVEQGEHTFARAVTLNTLGEATLTVMADGSAPETVSVTVLGASDIAESPLITEPQEGAVVSGTVRVEGSSAPNVNVSVLVDDQEFTRSETDAEGTFSVPLTGVADGAHTVRVALLAVDDTIGATSEPVSVTIDSVLPKLTKFTIAPASVVQVGSKVTITALSEAKLKNARIEVGKDKLNLVEVEPGTYTGEIETKVVKDYLIDVVLTDAAGNAYRERDAGALRVVAELPSEEETPTEETPAVTAEKNILSVATTGKNGRVDVTWPRPVNSGDIAYYVINYGTQAGSLDRFYETPDNGTRWYVGELQNDTQYYFLVESYSSTHEKLGYSDEVSAIPTTVLGLAAQACANAVRVSWKAPETEDIARFEVAYGVTSGEFLESTSVPGTQTSVQIPDLVNGTEYYVTVRGLDARGEVVWAADEDVGVVPGGGRCYDSAGGPDMPLVPVTLNQMKDSAGNTLLYWNAVPGAASYRVYAGTKPGVFDLPIVTVTGTELMPKGLKKDREYYFAVRAVSGNSVEALAFSNVLKVAVGPEMLLALAGVLALAGAGYVRRKK